MSRLFPRRDERYRHVPYLDYWLGQQVGNVLTWLGKRQAERGDWHMFNHTWLAVRTGNSNHFADTCGLPANRAINPHKGVTLNGTWRQED